MKNILYYIFGIPMVSFLLFQFAFIFNWFLIMFILLFFPKDFARTEPLFMPVIESIIVIGVLILVSYALKSNVPLIFKGSFFGILLGFIYSTIGISFYQWPLLCYPIGILTFMLVIWYLYQTNKGWIYYYVTGLISIVMLFFTLAGIDI